MNSTTILLAEDDSNDVFFFQRALEKVTTASSLRIARDGKEVVEYLQGDGGFGDRGQFPLPRVLVLDLNMPRKNGFEVLEWLRQTPPYDTLPAVVLTSSEAERDRQRAGKLGANGFYVKPTNPRQLTELIREILAHCANGSAQGCNAASSPAMH